jgi:hypothetical protein
MIVFNGALPRRRPRPEQSAPVCSGGLDYAGIFSRAVPQRGKSVLVGEGDRLGAVAYVNLGEQVVDVAFDGAFANDELYRDLAVRHACGDE